MDVKSPLSAFPANLSEREVNLSSFDDKVSHGKRVWWLPWQRMKTGRGTNTHVDSSESWGHDGMEKHGARRPSARRYSWAKDVDARWHI